MAEGAHELAPDEIRAIRRELGLTQVEAGKLLGGGPRAFTKYEAGTVKPVAATVTLLRLLRDNPDMISTLTGRKMRPTTARTGNGPFEVTGHHVAALDERNFPVLLQRLLYAEADANGIPTDGIHVASNINAPDAGEDGRIEWKGSPERTSFLPSRLVSFQLKSGKVVPSAAAREVLTGNRGIKEMVHSALQAGGHYVMLCAYPYTGNLIHDREERIRQTLRDAGLYIENTQVQFRDADMIAGWVNRHSTVAIWLKEQTGHSIAPFRSWTYWRSDHEKLSWVKDARLSDVRVHLRERILEPRGVARVAGLSGVGMSRLVLEALAPDGENCSISNLVLYADESETDRHKMIGSVQTLTDSGTRAIAVVDCCTPETRRALEKAVGRTNSQLSLITIEDEVSAQDSSGAILKIGEASRSVVKGIIDRESPGLPSEDRRRLIEFSDGFPKIAIGVARAWSDSDAIAHATDNDLVKTYVLGRAPMERDMSFMSAMLLGAFGRIDVENVKKGDLHEIAALGRGLGAADLRVAVERFVTRGVAQRRGKFATLRPRQIALSLAELQWREWSKSEWDEVLAGSLSPDLRALAARQLAFLNTTDVAREVVAHTCRHGGPFDTGKPEPSHAEVLFSLAQIDPWAVIDRIECFLDAVGDLSEIKGAVRRYFVRTLEKTAFSADTFKSSACILLRLAVFENENFAHNATGQFVRLFPVILGGTEIEGCRRLVFLDEASKTDNHAQLTIIVQALTAGLEADYFSPIGSAETHGFRPALKEWKPANDDTISYVKGCLKRLARFAQHRDGVGNAARTGIGSHVRSLIRHGLVDAVENAISLAGDMDGVWVKSMEGLGAFLKHDVSDNELARRVRVLLSSLEPKSMDARVKFFVTDMPWDYPFGKKADFPIHDRQLEIVRDLGAECVRDPDFLRSILPRLSRDDQRMAAAFGESIADNAEAPSGWLEPLKRGVIDAPSGERNFDMLSGYLAKLAAGHGATVADFKREAARSPDLAPALPLICWRIGIAPSDIKLVVKALGEGILSPGSLMQWSSGGKLSQIPEMAVTPLFEAMFDQSSEAFSVGVHLLGMYVHRKIGRLEQLRPLIRKAAENIRGWALSSDEVILSRPHFENIMSWVLKKGRRDPDARETALSLASALAEGKTRDNQRLVEPVIPILLSNFAEIVWPLIGNSIVSDRKQTWILQSILGEKRQENKSHPPILKLPEETLFAWCRAHLEQAPAFLARIIPVLADYRRDAPERRLHPVASRMLEEFGDRDDVLNALSGNIYTVIGWGSMTTYFEFYQEPLLRLRNHSRPEVQRWADRTLRGLRESVNQERIREDEWKVQREI